MHDSFSKTALHRLLATCVNIEQELFKWKTVVCAPCSEESSPELPAVELRPRRSAEGDFFALSQLDNGGEGTTIVQ